MTRFGSDPQAFFNAVYQGDVPWNIGGPQPAMVSLLEAWPPESPVLDVGCGSGDLAIYLAQSGFNVLGIDFVDAAIRQARKKASALPLDVARLLDFQVADALKPSLLNKKFTSVVDSGFYHLFDEAEGQHLLDEIKSILLPGGRYYLLAFAVEFPIPNVPRGVTEEEVRSRFTSEGGWRILDLRSDVFHSRVAPVPAIAACIERLSTTPLST